MSSTIYTEQQLIAALRDEVNLLEAGRKRDLAEIEQLKEDYALHLTESIRTEIECGAKQDKIEELKRRLTIYSGPYD